MTDITKCEGTNCPMKEKCYRYLSISSQFGQSFFMDIPYKDGKCEFYWETDPNKEVVSKLDKLLD